MDDLSLSVAAIVAKVKEFLSEDKHEEIDAVYERYATGQMTKALFQFELRCSSGLPRPEGTRPSTRRRLPEKAGPGLLRKFAKLVSSAHYGAHTIV